jgi:hypothetical protein
MIAIMPSGDVPEMRVPDESDPRYELWQRVQDAVRALPAHFRTITNIEGLAATDLFTLNSTLGATIEVQVVDTLNRIRKVWDPDDEWLLYSFERQSQTFPDVRLVARKSDGSVEIPFAMELKGWYLLSKEGEPSFRYQVTPSACSEWDLLVVVPWHLDNVLAGRPRVLEPFITSARYAAEYRNYWWQYLRRTNSDTRIVSPSVRTPPPYPSKSEKISDKPVSDSGKNFGRIARIGLMDEYVDQLLDHQIGGIRARHWVDFFRIYAESKTIGEIERRLTIAQEIAAQRAVKSDNHLRVIELLDELFAIVGLE